ncbi:MAG: PaaI family thioesterase [Acidiferrobacterales bacterium]|nr:PaaI family thioesterase [Acidiferrobacterales bacterium]
MSETKDLQPQEKLSGLELLQQIVDGERPHPTIAGVINMRFEQIEKGRVLFSAMADDRHINPMDGVHGGFCATLLDSVTGCAVHSALEAGVPFGTIELNVKMMRPVPKGQRLIAEGKLINLSRSLGVSEGTVKDEAGKLYAHATSTCMLIRSKSTP